MKSFGVGLAVIFTTLTSTVSAVCTLGYIVQAGDTCNAIALAHGISTSQIFVLNPHACPNIFVGQRLCLTDSTYNCQPVVPVNTGQVACTDTSSVLPGDSCDIIAARFAIPSFAVPLINPNISCSALVANDFICVASPQINCSKVNTVKSGDSCTGIATSSNITVNQLVSLNPNVNVNCTNIFPGEVLCVAPSA
ncbi:carbohydrate-binding module family 50 protein [Sphaerobolus stellatus SS14]|uniref:Carbohydrate-binding module family 50 protein n=1 Tax=Sphaerobolus stellatus (strain SS14) TaxID=990650 RepID=A0A0C9UKS9_SPHS4|nr:carbohydrate-binding module family 50 protein [Sphaerobolus stellatus SS14]